MFNAKQTPVVILTDGHFGTSVAKLATGVLRYGQWPVVAILDSTQAGKTVGQVIPHLQDTPVAKTPIIDNLAQLKQLPEKSPKPKALILGTAPIGGQFPEHWRDILKCAIESYGLHLINGMHQFLNDDPQLRALAEKHGVTLWDVRDPAGYYDPGERYKNTNQGQTFWNIARHLPRPQNVRVATMVGSDCSVGKMFSALELERGARERGLQSAFVATGQTGIIIHGQGVPLDRVVADYMAGLMESAVFAAIENKTADSGYDAEKPLWIFVEGQGSLLHPAYSGVTIGLLHGSRPDAMILCHNPAIDTIKGGYKTPLPDLKTLIRVYEDAASWPNGIGDTQPVYPHAKVLGVSLNTSALDDAQAEAAIEKARAETGLSVTDPVRFGVENLLDALLAQLA